jgi:probable phosphoglycerate mutase
MPVVLLVRHGENEYVKKGRLAGRLPGVHLNDNGRAQAQSVADRLVEMSAMMKPAKKNKRHSEVQIKAVYSSPLERTMETAAPIASALGVDVIPREGLIEVDFGKWQDKKIKGLSRLKLWKIVQGAPSRMRFPKGESFADAQYRVCRELDSLAKKHEDKDIFVCVSHSDVIKLAVAYYIGLPLDMFQRLHIAPASITTLLLGEGYSRLLSLNYEISFTLSKS